MATSYQVREAIRKSGGERLTIGCVFPFVCASCGETRRPPECAGGIWVSSGNGKRESVLICNRCSVAYAAPTEQAKKCLHEAFVSCVEVARITNDAGIVERYQANVRVVCDQCQTAFRFIGLPAGLDLNGAAVSIDGAEARLCIAPKGEVMSELEGTPIGFTIRKGPTS